MQAGIAQLVEHQLPKLRAASSNLVSRSDKKGLRKQPFCYLDLPTLIYQGRKGQITKGGHVSGPFCLMASPSEILCRQAQNLVSRSDK